MGNVILEKAMTAQLGPRSGRLPDFVVVGATKSGTTSLDFYLSLHPEIHMARPKEPRFFIDEKEPFGRWGRGVDWYRSLFRSEKPLCGETTPGYAIWPHRQGVFERMGDVVPGAKIVFVVREHFARLRSAYLMGVRYRGRAHSFSEFVRDFPGVIDASMYGLQVRNILRFYSLEKICVLAAEDLRERRQETLSRLFGFLGVDPDFRSPLFSHRKHVSSWHAYPNAVGKKLLRSRGMAQLEAKLPPSAFYHLRNSLVALLPGRKPSTDLPAGIEQALRVKFRDDTHLLQELTGRRFPALGG